MIDYTYEIINVDTAAKVMEIVYSSPGRDTQHISARLPYENESLEAVIHMYSPVAYWLHKEMPVMEIATGTTGTVASQQPTFEELKTTKLLELAAWRFQKEISGTTVNGIFMPTDRESKAQLLSAYTVMGNSDSIEWKTPRNGWIQFTKADIANILQSINTHVQNAFNDERALYQLINSAQTIEELNNIVLP